MSRVPYVLLPDDALAGAAAGAVLELDARARHHLERVLRLAPGTAIEVADGRGRESLATLGRGTVVVEGPIVEHAPATTRIRLLQAMPKGRKLDDVIRSVTELGVDAVTVVVSARSVSRPDDERGPRLQERWVDVARAAAEQARRPWLPTVDGPFTLAETLARESSPIAGIVGHPDAEATMRTALGSVDVRDGGEVVGAVGPEGGWTDEEVALLAAQGLRPATLGGFTLRTEHAGFALCTILAYYLGRMG